MSTEPKPGGPFHRSFAARLRSWFFTGLVIFGPVAATGYIAWWVVDTIDNWVKPLAPANLWPDTYLPVHVPGFGVVAVVIGLTLLGFRRRQHHRPDVPAARRGDGRPHAGGARPLQEPQTDLRDACSARAATSSARSGWSSSRSRARGRWSSSPPSPRRAVAEALPGQAMTFGVPALHPQPDHRLLFLRPDRRGHRDST